KRSPSILPQIKLSEALDTNNIHSASGKLKKTSSLMTGRPFTSPYHTTSEVALVGGGSCSQPGEVSLAHSGVLFWDE
ncbi:ATP-binding protein, partial [Ornithobacterium rhinotracheale]